MKDTVTETVNVPQVQLPLSLNLTESPNFRWGHDYPGKRLYCPALLIARYDPVSTFQSMKCEQTSKLHALKTKELTTLFSLFSLSLWLVRVTLLQDKNGNTLKMVKQEDRRITSFHIVA